MSKLAPRRLAESALKLSLFQQEKAHIHIKFRFISTLSPPTTFFKYLIRAALKNEVLLLAIIKV